MKYLDINHVEAMGYQKYGLVKERIVRMRDGRVVVRREEGYIVLHTLLYG